MSAVVIAPYNEADLLEIESIFFESSTKKNFSDAEERRSFQWKYLGSYLDQSPELTLVAKQGERTLGYVCGSTQTDFNLQPHMRVFEDLLIKYSAHLHINCHAGSRDLGIGRLLIEELENKLQGLNIEGLHIMTGQDSRNRSFYQKMGFSFEETRIYEDRTMLMMGKKLTALVRHI